MTYIDFRSDTVTKPTQEMLASIDIETLGDDVYGDDKCAKELEDYCASLLGKEAGLFVPSGTFANQLAIMTHTNRGDEVIVSEKSHIFNHEVGGTAVLSGVNLLTIPYSDEIMSAEAVEKSIRNNDIHYPNTALICIENAHSMGRVMTMETMASIKKVADTHRLPVHMDGARFFNAARKLDVSFDKMAIYADSINICLSKGLCAPAGSLLIGKKSFIEKARRFRKMLGGGMRQVGILAAPGLMGLKNMIGQVDKDHEHLAYLYEGLKAIKTLHIDEKRLDINMLFFKLDESLLLNKPLENLLYEEGIKINSADDDGVYRLMTHHDVSKEAIDKLCSTMKAILN